MPAVVRTSRPLVPLAGVTAAEVRRRADQMLARLNLGPRELSVLLTDDRRIHRLNRDYRSKDRPTDVLAFAMDEGDGRGADELLGDVVISLETAARQAAERRRPPLDEVTHLLAHGLLHLVGYDHETDAEHRAMERMARVLRAAVAPEAPNAAPKRAPKGAAAASTQGSKRVAVASTQGTKRAAGASPQAPTRAPKASKQAPKASTQATKRAPGASKQALARGKKGAAGASQQALERGKKGAATASKQAPRGPSTASKQGPRGPSAASKRAPKKTPLASSRAARGASAAPSRARKRA